MELSTFFPSGVEPVHYLISVVIGCAVVLLFASELFDQLATPPNPVLFETTLPASLLGAKARLRLARTGYLSVVELFYIALSLAGPQAFVSLNYSLGNGAVGWPLLVALALTGVVPKVPWLKKLEISVRTWSHEWALIPEAVREIANQLSRAEFVLPDDVDPAELADDGLIPEYFLEDRSSLHSKWARLRFVTHRLQQMRDGSDSSSLMDSSFLKVLSLPTYDRELQQIAGAGDRLSLELAKVKAFAPDSTHGQRSEKLRQDVVDLARRVWIFLSCSAQASKRNDDDIISELNKFGFQLRYLPKDAGIFNRYAQSFLIVGVAVFVVSVLGNFLLEELPHRLAIVGALKWACGGVLLHGSAVFTALRYHAALLTRGEWDGRPTNILAAVIRATIVSAVLISLYALIVASLPAGYLLWVPAWGLLGGVTAAFVTSFVSRRISSPTWWSRVRDPFLQGTGTAAAAWILLNLLPASAALTSKQEAFRVLIAFVIGGTIGFLIPSDHRRRNPYHNDRFARARLDDMQSRAMALMGDQEEVTEWLYQRIPNLQMSPFEAARTTVSAEKVFEKLRAMERSTESYRPQRPSAVCTNSRRKRRMGAERHRDLRDSTSDRSETVPALAAAHAVAVQPD